MFLNCMTIEGMEELGLNLNAGDRLDFFREPDNPHDRRAIAIKCADGVKIGYVPKADNVIFARLMDAGKLLIDNLDFTTDLVLIDHQIIDVNNL